MEWMDAAEAAWYELDELDDLAGPHAAADADDDWERGASAAPARSRRTQRPRTLMDTVTATGLPALPRVPTTTAPRTAVRAVVPRTRELPAVVARTSNSTLVIPGAARGVARPAPLRQTPPRLVAFALLLVITAVAVVGQRLLPADAASACAWHTVVPNDTLGNLGYWNHTNAMAIARANHIANPNRIYVGQRLCIPRQTWAAAHSAPAVPQGQTLAVPIIKAPAQAPAPAKPPFQQPAPTAGILPGEPCTGDRSIVWTVPVSRWAVPPGCFGGVYSPNPANFLANGHIIPGFGWCNWWPEALLRDPNAIFRPGHSVPRVGAPVYWAPQPGDRTGHYGFVESIGPNGWILISEMNMYWRGAGWAKVNYRYIRVDYPGASYRY
jgi:LysM repeat protein